MCPSSVLCRLCLCFCSEFKALVDESGEYNDIYVIASIYFDAKLLTTEICLDCWQHIHAFYEYQQSVIKAQSNLNDVKIESASSVLEMVQIDKGNDDILKEEEAIEKRTDLIDYNPFDSDDDGNLSPETSNANKIKAFGDQKIKEAADNIKQIDIYKNHDNLSTHDKYKFKCSICGKDFKHASGLRRHIDTHTPREIYKCPYCPTKFQGKSSLPRHVRQFHPNEVPNFNNKNLKSLNSCLLKCEIFSEEYIEIQNEHDASETIIEQLNNSVEESLFNDAICKEETIEPDDSDGVDIKSKRIFKCSKCEREYSKANDLRYHAAVHTHEDIYKCPYCTTKLTLPRNISRHIKILHPEKYNEHISSFSYCTKKLKEKSISPRIKRSYSNNDLKKINRQLKRPKLASNVTKEEDQTTEIIFGQLNSFNDTTSKEGTTTESKCKYKCLKCDREYSKPTDLRDHMASHKNEALNQCPYCPAKLSLPRNVRRHIKALHPDKYVTKVDDTKVDLNLLGRHLTNSYPTLTNAEADAVVNEDCPNYDDYDAFIAKWKQVLECDICKNSFKNFDFLRQHFKFEHPRDKCYVVCCEQKILYRSRLVDHIRLHLDPNSFKCAICGRCSNNSRLLKLHMRSHSDEKPFQCNVCHKKFRLKSKLSVHIGTHSSERNHFCEVCNKGFSTILLLKRHRYVHKELNVKHLCDQCGKPCFSANDLKKHLLQHHGIEIFKSNTKHLCDQEHLLQHDGIKISKSEWFCDICGAQLKTRLTLKSHKLTCHNDNKTAYVCSECGKFYSTKLALSTHKSKIHRKKCVRNFQCSICLKIFTSSTSLRSHGATHTKENHYQCPHCPLKLRQKKNIPRHIQIAHPTEFGKMNRRKRSKMDLSLIEQKIVL